ncbi:SNF2 family N-terminal domain-containing protein [Fennellomyces sp. T-0311]|nr:SNF2 family N-terminal domain-containing protein [Fennellomyces sp. T-0311]
MNSSRDSVPNLFEPQAGYTKTSQDNFSTLPKHNGLTIAPDSHFQLSGHPDSAESSKRRRIAHFHDAMLPVIGSYARPPLSMPARLPHNDDRNIRHQFVLPHPQFHSYKHPRPLVRSQSQASLRTASEHELPPMQPYPAPPAITPSRSTHTAADYHQPLPPLPPRPAPPLQQRDDDDDLIVDEEMTNKNVCVGMIKTDIVTARTLDLVKDEQFEPIRLEYQGVRESNYSFTVKSRGMPEKFYGWVPFEDTKILGPLVDHRLIWWDAVIPRGKVNHARTPLYIIIYCKPLHVDFVARTFSSYHATLKEPPFFNSGCRYKNPHSHLQQEVVNARPTMWSVGRPGRPSSLGSDQSAMEQTRRDIAQLLDSIPNDSSPSKKRKRRRLEESGTSDNQIVLSDDDDNDVQDKEDEDDEMQIDGAQVEGLTVRLMPHQSRGVEWMIGREANETSCGGILADMGLGKTIQTIALVSSTMEEAAKRPTLIVTPLALIQQWANEIRTKTEKGRMSVLVYHGASRSKDPAIFYQYDVVVTTYQVVASDMPNTTKRGRRRNINEDESMDTQTPSPSEDGTSPSSSTPGSPNSRKQDSDGSMKPGFGPLFQIEWYRVVLDEAQQIKNRNTRSALSCSELAAQKRWCLTGTPMQNHVDELYSLLRFLRIQPLCDYQAFKKTISVPIQAGQGQLALERLKVVLMAVMLRRTKQILKSADTGTADEVQVSSVPASSTTSPATTTMGTQDDTEKASEKVSTELSLQLPSRNKRDVVLTFSSSERTLYDFLNMKTKSTVEKLFRAGKGERNYLNMLCMLLRLRQACDHPQLVLKAMGSDADALELATGMANSSSNGRKEAREANEAAAQRAIMAKMAADLGWQGVGQVGQSVFDKSSLSASSTTCELCGKSIAKAGVSSSSSLSSSSYCLACTSQIEQHALQDNSLMTSSKINKVLELLDETRRQYPREKTIIFSQFTSMLDLMEEQLQRSGFKYCRYDGSMSNLLRERNLDALRTDPECTVMLISLKCGSLGLNLTAANHVILMDVWWNPAVEEQAIDRVHRIGQRLPVRVVRLVIDGTIEQKIIQLQQKKAQMVQGALGDGMIKNTKLTMREIRSLFDI